VTPSVHADITGHADKTFGESSDLDLLVEAVHRDSLDKRVVRGSLADIERLVVNRSPTPSRRPNETTCVTGLPHASRGSVRSTHCWPTAT